jgi:hypothetical protein
LRDKNVGWVVVKGNTGSFAAHSWSVKIRAATRSALPLVALAALCSCTLAQERTAEDWIETGKELLFKGSLEESVEGLHIPGSG